MFKKVKVKIIKDTLDISYDLYSISLEEWIKILKQYPNIKNQFQEYIDLDKKYPNLFEDMRLLKQLNLAKTIIK